jgi:hypothetical protein
MCICTAAMRCTWQYYCNIVIVKLESHLLIIIPVILVIIMMMMMMKKQAKTDKTIK